MQDVTTGSLSRHLLKTSSFMLIAMVFQTLYVLIDLYWVARLGTDAVAAVAVSSNLMFFVLSATQMLGVGTTTLVSHAVGRKDLSRMPGFALRWVWLLSAVTIFAQLTISLLLLRREFRRRLVFVAADASAPAAAS